MNQNENLKTIIDIMRHIVSLQENEIRAMSLEERITYENDLYDLERLERKLNARMKIREV